MKALSLILIMAVTAIPSLNNPLIEECTVEYDSYKKLFSVCNHYVKVNGKKYTIIDNGCNETKESISASLKKNSCDVPTTFDSYREDWASKK